MNLNLRIITVALAIGGLLTTSACGDDSGSAPPGGSPAESEPSSGESDLENRAKSRFIALNDLDGGWRESQPPDAGFGMTVCGVDIEPEEPRGSARQRFAQSGLGPFLLQYVQAHRDGMAEEVVGEVKDALSGCTTFTTKGEAANSPEVTFVIDEVEFAPMSDNAVVWRMTPQGETPVTQDVALVADGEFLIGLVSVSPGKAPDPQVITDAIAAIPEGE